LLAPWGSPVGGGLPTTAEAIGDALLGRHLIVFELLSLVLLGALVGAVVIARKELKE
jgi:NAD(P)H-quinone oxidoreductase subunit 6